MTTNNEKQSTCNNSCKSNTKSKSDKNKKKVKKLSQNSKYFDFYDDVKSGCHKVIDW